MSFTFKISNMFVYVALTHIFTFIGRTILYHYTPIRQKVISLFYKQTDKTPIPPIIQPVSLLNKTQQYILNKTTCFSKIIDNKTNNCNISPIFYQKDEYNKEMQNIKNTIEPEWQRRILFENTPKGNIIMYYDAFKQGFAYFSDTNCLEYKLLNAVAMKYVTVFRCLDLFVDDEFYESPMIKIYGEPEKTKTDETNKKIYKNTSTSGPFVTYKKTTVETTNKPETLEPIKTKEYNRNVFVCKGKTVNFDILQKPKPKQCVTFSSQFLTDLSQETALQKQVMSYKNFRQIRNHSHIED